MRGGVATIASKLAKMMTASSDVSNTPGLINEKEPAGFGTGE